MISKSYVVISNENLSLTNVFWENFLYHLSVNKENPLLIETMIGNQIFNDKKNGKFKPFSYHTEKEINSINLTDLSFELSRGKKQSDFLFEKERQFTHIFLHGALLDDMTDIYRFTDGIILLLKRSHESSSFLYNFLMSLRERMIQKPIGIIICGEKKIEDAAFNFLKLKDEMLEMISTQLEFHFLGFFWFSTQSISLAKKKKHIYINEFAEESFHGQIKYIHSRLNALELPVKKNSFFQGIAEEMQPDLL